jgi:transcriptional regulator with XRE-family HTH domain
MQSFPHASEYRVLVEELRKAREGAGMTQQQLADALHVHQTVVSKSELAVRRIDVIELRAWLQALGLSLVDFAIKLEDRLAAQASLRSATRRDRRNV